MDTELFLQHLQSIGSFYEGRMLRRASEDYPNLKSDSIDALSFFVQGYAFEHSGRSPSFAPAAVDVLQEYKGEAYRPPLLLQR